MKIWGNESCRKFCCAMPFSSYHDPAEDSPKIRPDYVIKLFNESETRCRCYQTFFLRRWWRGPVSKRVCPRTPLPVRSLNLRARPEQTQLEDLSDVSFLGKLLVLPANVRQDWKVFVRCKHSSLFYLVISNKEKKFYNIDSRSAFVTDISRIRVKMSGCQSSDPSLSPGNSTPPGMFSHWLSSLFFAQTGASFIKLLRNEINSVLQKRFLFVSVNHFHPSLIFAGKSNLRAKLAEVIYWRTVQLANMRPR
jgi:hypothetical protein